MRHPRKRTLLMVLLLLTGGAIINVAVAWGCAAIPDLSNAHRHYSLDRTWWGTDTDVVTVSFPGRLQVDRILILGTTMRPRTIGRVTPTPAQRTKEPIQGYLLAGWPLFAETCSLICDSNFEKRVSGGISLPIKSTEQSVHWRALPYMPLWPGFAINTIFYAAILWLPFAGFVLVRRRIRVRRGQCPACAYPVGSSTVCTECGKAVRIQNA